MKRAKIIGLVAVGVAVAVLAGSMVLGMMDRSGGVDPDEPSSPSARRVRVEVLNAAGVPGLARTATDRLRDGGYDVVFYGNARGFAPDSSMVLHRAGRREDADAVAALVDIPRVASRPDTTLYLEVTVVLGRDWSGIAADTVIP